jgi:hypothetical protein
VPVALVEQRWLRGGRNGEGRKHQGSCEWGHGHASFQPSNGVLAPRHYAEGKHQFACDGDGLDRAVTLSQDVFQKASGGHGPID